MGGDKRSVDRTPRDFLAAWWRGEAGPVPCGGCSALLLLRRHPRGQEARQAALETPVLDWRERLVPFPRGSRQVDMVVSGRKRRQLTDADLTAR
jgi:hypothetical protein